MGNYTILSCMLFILAIYLTFTDQNYAKAAANSPSNLENVHRNRNRPFIRLQSRPINQYTRLKPELNEFVVDDDDFFELNKRQTSDDYGHLRFGKRDEFDDYGHMRFGRSGAEGTRK